jgi:ABC-type branched-subunit amino acid transport system substrate-binding protein
VLAGFGATACSSSTSSTAAGGNCSGKPIKVMSIFTQSGPLALFGKDVPDAAAAASAAVNKTCALGRPLDVEVCDDQSTPNGSLECGRKAKAQDLAIIGFTSGPGSSDKGAQAANMPAFFTIAQNEWDNTSPKSFPTWQGVVQQAGNVSVAHALGAKSFTMAAIDVPGAHVQETIAKATAAKLGMKFSTVFFPLSTTDFAPIAQNVLNKHSDAITFLLPQGTQLISALIADGMDLSKTHLVASQGILVPSQTAELGSKINGFLEVGDFAPATDSSNAGIQQMKTEYAAAGKSFSDKLSVYAVDEWTAVHAFAEGLKGQSKSQINSLSSTSLTKALQSHGSYDLPTAVPFDFSKPVADASTYGVPRVFSNYIGVFKTENGKSSQVGKWQDLTQGVTVR